MTNLKKETALVARQDRIAAAFVPALVGATAVFALYTLLVMVLLPYVYPLDAATPLARFLGISNIVRYIAGLALFALTFLVLRVLLARTPLSIPPKPLDKAGRMKGFALLLTVITAFLLVYLSVTEPLNLFFGVDTASFAWRKLPFVLVLCAVIGAVLAVLRLALRGRDCSAIPLAVAYVATVLLAYFGLLYVNMVDLHHGVAYLESIINAYHGTPYNIYTTGIYGHYGIFFGLVLRLIGGNAVTMMHLVALCGALCVVACVYTIHTLTTKNYIRAIASLSSVITVAVLRTTNYWQLQPHRVLFPLLMVAFMAAATRKKSITRGRMAGGFALCAMAIVWNTESGLFCLAAFVLSLLTYFWQTNTWRARGMWKKYVWLCGGAIASFAAAVLFVNVYNLICGGGFIVKDFFFPIFENSYMNDALRCDLPGIVQVWIPVLLLFFLLLGLGLYHTRFARPNGKDFDPLAPVFVALAVVSLLNFSYYANRAAYFNLDICCQTAMIAMAVFADRFIADWRGIKKKALSRCRTVVAAVSLCSLVVLTVLAAQLPLSAVTLVKKEEQGIFDVSVLQSRADELAACVPEDYMLLGTGSLPYLFQLGRTPVHCYRDFSDLYVGGTAVAEQIVKDALAHGKVAFYLSDDTTVKMMEQVVATNAFRLESEGKVGDVSVLCFVLK